MSTLLTSDGIAPAQDDFRITLAADILHGGAGRGLAGLDAVAGRITAGGRLLVGGGRLRVALGGELVGFSVLGGHFGKGLVVLNWQLEKVVWRIGE